MAKRINKNLVVGLTMSLMFATTASAVWMLATLRDHDPEIYVQQVIQNLNTGSAEFTPGFRTENFCPNRGWLPD